jgi:hypothetical protein
MVRQADRIHPRLDPRLSARLARKKAQLDSYRPLPPDTVLRSISC